MKRRLKPAKRLPAAKALRSPALRQRIIPDKRRKEAERLAEIYKRVTTMNLYDESLR